MIRVPGQQFAFRRATQAIVLVVAMLALGMPCRAERPSEKEYLFPKEGGVYIGADYYPEHWPEERWETDLRMMKEAGFNIVRVAEFSWVLFEQLVEYVRDGGVLLTDCRTGVKDETNLAYDRTLPGLLSPALGIEIEEYESLGLGITDKDATTYRIQTESQLGSSYVAIHYADWITPTTARVMARYDQPHLEEFAAVTRNEHGIGIGWYVGTIAEEPEFYDKLVANLLRDAGIRLLVEPPAGVEVATRTNGERALLCVINHTNGNVGVAVPQGKRELLTDEKTDGTMRLTPFGVAVIELSAAELRPRE